MGRDFHKMKIYGLARRFLLRLYREVLPLLPESEARNLFSQLQRAGTSVVLNVVEGASNRSNKVFLNHLQYSYGSCKEVEVVLGLCFDLGFLEKSLLESLSSDLEELKASLYRFMRAVEKEVVVKQVNYSLL